MGKRRRFPAGVAKGLRSLQRKRFQHSCGRPIHPKSGIPSQENDLRNRIPRFIKKAQRGIRSEICFRVGVAPTALPKFFSSLPSPYGTGLTSAAPPALYGSHLRIGTETLLPRRGWPRGAGPLSGYPNLRPERLELANEVSIMGYPL